MTRRGVISLSSHVIRGSVGNRAAVHVLETLGHPVWSVPTIQLPWQPRHGKARAIVPGDEEFAEMLDLLVEAPWADEIGAVLTGYLGSSGQAEAIAHLVIRLKERNPGLLYACDPVIGDDGALYVPEERATTIRDRLLPLADIATPNRFELHWLSGKESSTLQDSARALGPGRVLVTSAWHGTNTGSLLVTPDAILSARHERVDGAPHGLGDFTAAAFLSHVLNGRPDEEALRLATASVLQLVELSVSRGANRLLLELSGDALLRPGKRIEIEAMRPHCLTGNVDAASR